MGGQTIGQEINARLWVLNLSDGDHSLLDIANRSGISFPLIRDAAKLLCEHGLMAGVPDRTIAETAESAACNDTKVTH
jgi:aminopeptidase-like protein